MWTLVPSLLSAIQCSKLERAICTDGVRHSVLDSFVLYMFSSCA